MSFSSCKYKLKVLIRYIYDSACIFMRMSRLRFAERKEKNTFHLMQYIYIYIYIVSTWAVAGNMETISVAYIVHSVGSGIYLFHYIKKSCHVRNMLLMWNGTVVGKQIVAI
jgi:hypothetical protein